jgi:amphi-Trp domain-containing protein
VAEVTVKDLSFEQKSSLSRLEAADQLAALAEALRKGGEAEFDLGSAVVRLWIPDKLRTEVEVEVGGGEIELEIELKWPTGQSSKAAPAAARTTGTSQQSATRPAARPTRSRKSTSPEKPKRAAAKRT